MGRLEMNWHDRGTQGTVVRKFLILGGTRDALDLGKQLLEVKNIDFITSLAGRTEEPDRSIGKTRKGGFGGINGLTQFLKDNKIDLLVDATHPFAVTISNNAVAAAKRANITLVRLKRPRWHSIKGDRWTECESVEDAARLLPEEAIAFLALGSQYLDAFNHRLDCHFIARMIDAPKKPLALPNSTLVLGKPKLDAADEQALFEHHAITHLVCRNSGGDLVYGKIKAARNLDIPVLIIKRPPLPPVECFENVDALARFIIKTQT